MDDAFIVTADWHLRSDRPRCRLDEDWEDTQQAAVEQVVRIANERRMPLLFLGDMFNTPQQPSRIVNMALEALESITAGVYLMAGNHDLPFHNWDNVFGCSFGTLWVEAVGRNKVIRDLNDLGAAPVFGVEPVEKIDLLFLHQLVFPSKKSIPPKTDAVCADNLLDKYKWARTIFTGDYHQRFVVKRGPRILINPGTILRQSADLLDYVPTVYEIELTDGYLTKITEIEIEDNEELVTDEYLRDKEAREDRVEAFVDALAGTEEVSLDFEANLKRAVDENRKSLGKRATEIIEELLEEAR